MYVYVKFEASPAVIKVISNVTIDEDCCPVVDGKLIHETPSVGESSALSPGNVDAISWFKSLPMEAVYIDCTTRDARWCVRPVKIWDSNVQRRGSGRTLPQDSIHMRGKVLDKTRCSKSDHSESEPEEPAFMPDNARPLFFEMDFNPVIDEMFERVEKLYSNWGELSKREEINKEIARILHCYVFPAVTFQKDDIPVLEECLRLVIHKQGAIDREIVDMERTIDITDTFLSRQKEVILASNHMTTQTYLQECRTDFVDTFYVLVTKDIQSKNTQFDVLQTRINDLKKRADNPNKLQELKAERDAMHEALQKLLDVREAIRTHLFRSSIPKKTKRQKKYKIDERETSLHVCFLKAHTQLVDHKDLLKQICYRKLHTTSVREAIESTVKILKHERPCLLGDFTEFSIYSDSQQAGWKQWKSMQSRVEGWMRGNNSLYKIHQEGCELIKDLVDGMLSDDQIASMGMTVNRDSGKEADNVTNVEQGSDGDREQKTSADPPLGSSPGSRRVCHGEECDEDISSQRAPMVRMIKEQIEVHMWDMAERIVKRMNFDASPGSRHLNRAWVCYSPHFWKEVGEVVERAYTHYHAPRARQVYQQASSAALADIMDGHFFQEVFAGGVSRESESGDPVDEAVLRVPSMERMSALSLDLQRCSMTDMYAAANKDGARLTCQMMTLEMMTQSICLETDSNSATQAEGESGSASTISTAEPIEEKKQGGRPVSSSGSDTCVKELSDLDRSAAKPHGSESNSIRSSHTVSSVLSLFDNIVEPYHAKVHEVLQAPDILEKMRAVWQSVDFLSRKTGELCKARGMDTLLPMSIFATASFSEELFVQYFIQLLILLDLRPSFVLHSLYDFSLTNAFSTYMFLFEARFSGVVKSAGGLGGDKT